MRTYIPLPKQCAAVGAMVDPWVDAVVDGMAASMVDEVHQSVQSVRKWSA